MKKLIAVLSLMLLINIVNAQTSTTNQAPATTTTSATTDTHCTGKEKKCKGKDKDCAAKCEAAKTSADGTSTQTMSADHASNGAVSAPAGKSCCDTKGKKEKSCCKGMSKASAVSAPAPEQPAAAPTPKH